MSAPFAKRDEPSLWREFTTEHRSIWRGVQLTAALALGSHLSELIALIGRAVSACL